MRADAVADGHQRHHGEAQPVGARIAGHEARQDAQRRAAFFARTSPTSLHMARLRRGEYLHQFGDDRAGQRAAGDDGRELPPLRGVAAEIGNDAAKKRCKSATIETIEVSHTSEVSGASKFILSALL